MASYASNYDNLEECERELNDYINMYENRISRLQRENNRLSREHGEILERYVQLSEQLYGTNNPSDEEFEVLNTIEEERGPSLPKNKRGGTKQATRKSKRLQEKNKKSRKIKKKSYFKNEEDKKLMEAGLRNWYYQQLEKKRQQDLQLQQEREALDFPSDIFKTPDNSPSKPTSSTDRAVRAYDDMDIVSIPIVNEGEESNVFRQLDFDDMEGGKKRVKKNKHIGKVEYIWMNKTKKKQAKHSIRWIVDIKNGRYIGRAPKAGVNLKDLDKKRDKDFGKPSMLPKSIIFFDDVIIAKKKSKKKARKIRRKSKTRRRKR